MDWVSDTLLAWAQRQDWSGIGVSALAIFLSAAITAYLGYRSNIRFAQRSAKVDRLARQLAVLYGPLRMLRYAGETAFATFKERYFPDRPELFWKGIEPTEDVYAAWRVWLKHTLMPINKQIESLLLEHGDLIEGPEIPKAVLDFLAHVSTLEAVVAQWDAGNYRDFKSGIRYPVEFNLHVEQTYKKLVSARRKAGGA